MLPATSAGAVYVTLKVPGLVVLIELGVVDIVPEYTGSLSVTFADGSLYVAPTRNALVSLDTVIMGLVVSGIQLVRSLTGRSIHDFGTKIKGISKICALSLFESTTKI